MPWRAIAAAARRRRTVLFMSAVRINPSGKLWVDELF
jgi:hypothetical protein